ncbi:MAG: tetratricopeptide repeat protein [Polyangiaceae bacterium]
MKRFLTTFGCLGLLSCPAFGQAIASPGAEPSSSNSGSSDVGGDSTELRAKNEARDRFAAGLKLYEDGEFALALIEFERAYSLVPDHRVLYNIGQVNIQLGRYSRAVRTLERYLAEGGERVPPDRKQAVQADLTMLAARTATLFVSVNVPGADIMLDNDVVATSPMATPLLVDAGEHRLVVRKSTYLTQTKPIALAGRDTLRLDVALEEEPKMVATEKTVIVERKPELSTSTSDNRGLYLALGWAGTGLLAAGWATTGYVGLSAAQDREDAIAKKTSSGELDRLETKAERWYVASDILGATTLLAAGGMLYYTLSRPSTPEKRAATVMPKDVTVSIGPSNLVVQGHF